MGKQVDVEKEIIECLEDTASVFAIDSGEVETSIRIITKWVYDTDNPTDSQMKSVYRTVSNLEKKGILYSRKTKTIDRDYDKFGSGGPRYEKEVCAIVTNGKIAKKC